MLWVCSSVKKYSEFRKVFQEIHGNTLVDLSKIPSHALADECDSIIQHHSDCSVFLGFLEAGWMISSHDQTRIRKLIRKFNVGVVLHFPESLPFSWKNEINTFYVSRSLNQNGNSNSIDNGCAIQDQSNV